MFHSQVNSLALRRSSASLASGTNLAAFNKTPTDFQVEHSSPTKPYFYGAAVHRSASQRDLQEYNNEYIYQTSIPKLLSIKSQPFAVSGHIPVDSTTLTLFFRSQSGITHSLDFPIDMEYETPPSLDVLIATSKPHATCELDGFSDRESLFYPPSLPLTTTLEIVNHPILDAVRSTLFPNIGPGHYLTAVRDKLEIVVAGGHMCPQRRIPQNDGKVATIIVTLPVRFRGGTMVVHDFGGNAEKFYGRGGKAGNLEWTAFLAECDHEVETVRDGCRMTISYNVYKKTFGPSQIASDSLIIPSDQFLDLVSPILNTMRGHRVAFYLSEDYDITPTEELADFLVPHLKGGDALLYHSLKLYKLSPELRWTAGGYVWPVDRTVACDTGTQPWSPEVRRLPSPPSTRSSPNRFSLMANSRGYLNDHYSDSSEEEEMEDLRARVEESGAVRLSDANIQLMSDTNALQGAVTKQRVPYVSRGVLGKLIVNVLLVVYVP